MKHEEILDAWDKDAKIDRTDLAEAAANIPMLHSKYLRIYTEEKLNLVKLQFRMKKLRLAKHEFLSQGPSKETQSKGWTLPARGMILKADMPMYMEADTDIADIQLKIDLSESKLAALESIMKAINNRSYIVRDIIEWNRWTGGA
jgi:hypothetical protein